MIQLDSWRVTLLDGAPVVRVTCPGCAQEYALDHEIAEDGTVSPSLDCPTEGCSFHDYAQLVDWPPRKPPAGL